LREPLDITEQVAEAQLQTLLSFVLLQSLLSNLHLSECFPQVFSIVLAEFFPLVQFARILCVTFLHQQFF
jgi:hypothetical protein